MKTAGRLITMTPLEKLEEAIREFAESQDEQGGSLADWFLGFSLQMIDSEGDIQYDRGYAGSRNMYGAVGVGGVALIDAREDLRDGEEEEEP
ncbi:hypothetical protein BH767_gp02 [Gordonia phage Cozz]|nr:hypothetical protein BH767_gp02 [Gordonia phage Cozz]ANA85708.1 hypothetical protein PBI_COZZ_2 [Gordonia phage Cozz]QCW22335.1 hypothetical protein SEA_AGATHA_2 [Gordonia phage Agatha]